MSSMDYSAEFLWCKSQWDLPKLTSEAEALIKQCSDLREAELLDVDAVIENSKRFPIAFPIQSVRLAELKKRKSSDVLKNNINSTYPLVHERVLRLMALFLVYKREHGSPIERALYKYMTVPELIDRILQKRAMCFFSRLDKYMLRDGVTGNNGWEAIGTPNQKASLTLDSYLSYDELKLSAMVFVSSYTACVNNGARKNIGVVNEAAVEENPVIIGVIGPRFQRAGQMDCEDILITETQNCKENGYGDSDEKSSRAMWRKLWADFYEVPSSTYTQASLNLEKQSEKNKNIKKTERQYIDRYVTVGKMAAIFDNEAYHKRLTVIAEASLLEADARARDAGKKAFLNVIGCGLGVWMVSPHQNDVYVLSFVECIRALMKRGALGHVSDVNFAYIKVSSTLLGLSHTPIIGDQNHASNGINIHFEDREPSSRLVGQHAGKLLVMTYPWDGNAHPGNEFWMGKLASSGDPAAACSTQVSELHNAYINPAVSSGNTRVVTSTEILTLKKYAQNIANYNIDV